MNTEIICILDRSGSMASMATEVVGGYLNFIAEQQKQPGAARLTLIQFDDRYQKDYEGVDLAATNGLLDFRPRGSTALFDAIGRTLNEQGERIAKEKWADLVLVNIITDGQENASHEYSQERVRQMTAHAEKNGWKCLFLAANQDAFAAAKSFGSSGQFAGNYQPNAQGMQNAYATTSATMSALRGGQALQCLVPGAKP